MKELRRTGRTTRMLQHAQKLEAEGHDVYVIVGNQREVNRFYFLLPSNTTIKVETASRLRNFNWLYMRLDGAHPNCRALVDHHAIEDMYGALLEELHRYD